MLESTQTQLHIGSNAILNWYSVQRLKEDPRFVQVDAKIQRMLLLHDILQRLPDGFNDFVNVTRSHIGAKNIHARIQKDLAPTPIIVPQMKQGRPIGVKDNKSRTQRLKDRMHSSDTIPEILIDHAQDPQVTVVGDTLTKKDKITVTYVDTERVWK